MTRKRKEPIAPDQEDYEAVEQRYGKLPTNATDEQAAHRYRLAQVNKLMREVVAT
jgi:hypothetical protein